MVSVEASDDKFVDWPLDLERSNPDLLENEEFALSHLALHSISSTGLSNWKSFGTSML